MSAAYPGPHFLPVGGGNAIKVGGGNAIKVDANRHKQVNKYEGGPHPLSSPVDDGNAQCRRFPTTIKLQETKNKVLSCFLKMQV